ncbi:unnamed protein product [Colias eurytheme]|nr:unnamed protein product [Colias eurytheme]
MRQNHMQHIGFRSHRDDVWNSARSQPHSRAEDSNRSSGSRHALGPGAAGNEYVFMIQRAPESSIDSVYVRLAVDARSALPHSPRYRCGAAPGLGRSSQELERGTESRAGRRRRWRGAGGSGALLASRACGAQRGSLRALAARLPPPPRAAPPPRSPRTAHARPLLGFH